MPKPPRLRERDITASVLALNVRLHTWLQCEPDAEVATFVAMQTEADALVKTLRRFYKEEIAD